MAAAADTFQQFYTDVLTQLGITPNAQNLAALASVANYEGLNARDNPLNSVVPSGNSTSFNSVGVQAYNTFQNGVAGTVKLLQGSPWRGVVAQLKSGSESQILDAFDTEYQTWGSHGPSAASSSRVNSILNGNVDTGATGSSTGGASITASLTASTSSGPTAPYDPGSGAPSSLTPTVRQQVIAYIEAIYQKYAPGTAPVTSSLAGDTDTQLEALYAQTYASAGALNKLQNEGFLGVDLNPADIVNNALSTVEGWGSKIVKWLLNAFLVVAGIVVVIIAVVLLAKDSDDHVAADGETTAASRGDDHAGEEAAEAIAE